MTVNYKDVEDAFDYVSCGRLGEHEAYLNLHTGKTYWYSEFGDNEEELPEDIYNEDKYIALPHKNELDLGKNLALKFSYEYLPSEADKIESFFGKKGAYSKLKDTFERNGILEKWYEYENKAQENALREWCVINEVKING